MTRYAVIRSGGGGRMDVTGAEIPPWESLSSVMFTDVAEAWDFARLLDHALVYELVPVAGDGRRPVDNTPEHGVAGDSDDH